MSCKSRDSMMDDVPVKISERYKPPRKIILPISFQHRLQHDPSLDQYNFTFEEHIIKKLEEWKDLKLLAEKKRKINEESKSFQKELTNLKNKLCEIRHSSSDSLSNIDIQQEINYPKEENFSPSSSKRDYDNSILTPIPISPASASCNSSKLSRFNISDFESDTSSPFDNMELKTINDMEELAHVLKTTLPDNSIEQPSCSKDISHKNGYQNPFNHFPNKTNQLEMVNLPIYDWNECDKESISNNLELTQIKPSSNQEQSKSHSRSVPDIVRELEDELIQSKERYPPPPRPSSFGSSAFEEWKPWPVIESPDRTFINFPNSKNKSHLSLSINNSSEKITTPTENENKSTLENPYEKLSIEEKRVVDHAIEMGFPRGRAARGCQKFGSDEKKVVEYLLEIQALEEKGFSEDLAEKGYIDNNMNLKEALKHLELKKQFLIYGFPEEKVTSALLLYNNDSEMTLEHLIS